MKAICILVLLLAAPVVAPLGAQVIQTDCGSSTLYRGSGCGSTLYLPDSTATASVGYSQGQILFGASDTWTWQGNMVTVGSKQIGFGFSGGGITLELTGISLEHKTDADDSMSGFVGMASNAFVIPFVQAVRFQQEKAAAGVFIKHKWKGAKLYSLDVADGNRFTAAQGIDYQFNRVFRVSGSGGILNSSPFITGSMLWHPSAYFSVYGQHQFIISPYEARGDSLGVSFNYDRWTAQASVNESNSLGRQLTGESLGVGVRISWLQTNVNWYKSGTRTLTSENFTQSFPTFHRLTLTENITQNQGVNSYSFGGGFTWRNRMSVSLSHSIVFLLNGEGFQEITGIQLSLRLPHDVTANFSNVITPEGKQLWTGYLETYQQVGSWSPGNVVHAAPIGKFEFAGRCELESGEAVEGCAVQIGRSKTIVYSNSHGEFFIHGKKDLPQQMVVLPEIFASPVDYEIVSAPNTISPGSTCVVILRIKLN